MFTKPEQLRLGTLAAAMTLVTACGNARGGEPREDETAEYAAPEADVMVTVAAGTELRLELLTELGTDRNKPGDRFDAVVDQPIVRDGDTAVPAGAAVRGHVTAVQKRSDDMPAVIKLDFDEIEIFGTSQRLDGTLVQADIDQASSTSTGEAAAKVGVTTAAGAILGRVIGGNSTGTLVGAAVGAAAGTAIVLSAGDDVAKLREGTMMTVRLDEPLRIDTTRR